eukprot:NODE_199_length_13192_cov_0.539219.p4 type:complete len:377 gc:universal NODE_199_length_13192_cov_0.539219:7003-5873(-)
MKRSPEDDQPSKIHIANDDMEDSSSGESDVEQELYLPDKKEKELDVDMDVYDVFYDLNTPWPCLTFAIKPNANKKVFPWHMQIVAGGSSSDKLNDIYDIDLNQIFEVTEEEDPLREPVFECDISKISGDILRLKYSNDLLGIIAKQFEIRQGKKSIFSMDVSEGFGLESLQNDWLIGASNGVLKHVQFTKSGYLQHEIAKTNSSIEDIKASPNEPTVFATAQGNGLFNVWDTRLKQSGVSKQLAECDINVIDWNKSASLMLFGMDDGSIDIYDLRCLDESLAHYEWHQSPINAIEWHPYDSTTFVSCSDEQVNVWDCSVEEADVQVVEETKEVPPQLMFVHQGQDCIRDVHWHPTYGCLITSALSGFHVFKTFNME